jgi:hypothetical protein
MSPSGRYQSRLFNLISRQSRRLSDRVVSSLRHSKIAVTWSAQILLYPAYVLFQTMRLVSRQIGQAVQQVLPKLQTAQSSNPTAVPLANPTTSNDEWSDRSAFEQLAFEQSADDPLLLQADTPILRSIAALHSFVLPMLLQPTAKLPSLTAARLTTDEPITAESPAGAITLTLGSGLTALNPKAGLTTTASDWLTAKKFEEINLITAPTQSDSMQSDRIRGIASLLSDRRLVLTTEQNWVLDILTADQQTQLQQRMIWELASYWRSQHLLHLQHQNSILLPLASDQPHLLPPVRLLRRLMSWVQTSPVAIAANLFHEAELIRAMPFPEQTISDGISTLLSDQEIETTVPSPPKLALLKRTVALTSIEELRALKQWLNQALSALTSKSTVPAKPAVFTSTSTLTDITTPSGIPTTPVSVPISLMPAALSMQTQILRLQRGQSPAAQTGQPQNISLNPMAIATHTAEFFRNQQQWFGRALRALWIEAESKPIRFENETHNETADLVLVSPEVLTERTQTDRSSLIQLPLIQALRRRGDRKSPQAQPPILANNLTTVSDVLTPASELDSFDQVFDQADVRQSATILVSKRIRSTSDTSPAETNIVEAQTPLPIVTPTWIETEATLVGYVKHPLERLLAWLDTGMLWLEEVSTKILQWLRHQ